jgi:UDP-3-O-acyl-N-acetylglucosamine deacetylase
MAVEHLTAALVVGVAQVVVAASAEDAPVVDSAAVAALTSVEGAAVVPTSAVAVAVVTWVAAVVMVVVDTGNSSAATQIQEGEGDGLRPVPFFLNPRLASVLRRKFVLQP